MAWSMRKSLIMFVLATVVGLGAWSLSPKRSKVLDKIVKATIQEGTKTLEHLGAIHYSLKIDVKYEGELFHARILLNDRLPHGIGE